jgi:HNH endonuclease
MINPYDGYKVYGPYLHKKEGRRMIVLVSGIHRTSTSYARYLMSMKLGRLLDPLEEVDHKDDNKLNDDINNLQILNHQQNSSKNRSPTMITLVCPWCNNEFERERRQVLHKPRKYPACCSRSCAGKYQRKMELLEET